MSTKRVRRIKAFARRFAKAAGLVLPLVLLFQITIPGAALCLQASGRVSVEGYVNGLCTYAFAATYQSDGDDLHSLECANKAHRLECVDIPLSGKRTEKKAQAQNDIDAQVLAHALAVTVAYAAPRPPVIAERIPIPPGRLKSETKALIKSTVLVC